MLLNLDEKRTYSAKGASIIYKFIPPKEIKDNRLEIKSRQRSHWKQAFTSLETKKESSDNLSLNQYISIGDPYTQEEGNEGVGGGPKDLQLGKYIYDGKLNVEEIYKSPKEVIKEHLETNPELYLNDTFSGRIENMGKSKITNSQWNQSKNFITSTKFSETSRNNPLSTRSKTARRPTMEKSGLLSNNLFEKIRENEESRINLKNWKKENLYKTMLRKTQTRLMMRKELSQSPVPQNLLEEEKDSSIERKVNTKDHLFTKQQRLAKRELWNQLKNEIYYKLHKLKIYSEIPEENSSAIKNSSIKISKLPIQMLFNTKIDKLKENETGLQQTVPINIDTSNKKLIKIRVDDGHLEEDKKSSQRSHSSVQLVHRNNSNKHNNSESGTLVPRPPRERPHSKFLRLVTKPRPKIKTDGILISPKSTTEKLSSKGSADRYIELTKNRDHGFGSRKETKYSYLPILRPQLGQFEDCPFGHIQAHNPNKSSAKQSNAYSKWFIDPLKWNENFIQKLNSPYSRNTSFNQSSFLRNRMSGYDQEDIVDAKKGRGENRLGRKFIIPDELSKYMTVGLRNNIKHSSSYYS